MIDLIKNTFIYPKNEDVEIEVGDIKQPDFKPRMKIKRWDNAVNFSVGLISDHKGTHIKDVNNKCIWDDDHGTKAHFYQKDKDNFEFEIEIAEKPASNMIILSIETKGLDFFYQPPLNNEYKVGDDDGMVAKVTETDCYDIKGKSFRHRPENVVGSYAVYHKTMSGDYSKRGGNNYRAGKAFHIYRPNITDAEGNWTWAYLNIDEDAGILSITIDPNWLETAIYPILIDPTFGETGIGTTDEYASNLMQGSWFNCPEPGTADKITVYTDYGGVIETAIYKKSDSSKVCESAAISSSAGWNDLTIAGSPALTNQDYWLLVSQPTAGPEIRYDTGAPTDKGHRTTAYSHSTWPDPITITGQTRLYSLYCTYTTTGAGATPKGRTFYGPFRGPFGGPIG